jgi:hypothetical protein
MYCTYIPKINHGSKRKIGKWPKAVNLKNNFFSKKKRKRGLDLNIHPKVPNHQDRSIKSSPAYAQLSNPSIVSPRFLADMRRKPLCATRY